jgi:hypothetical protein
MGSAALDALLKAGVDVMGFDPIGPGDNRGSSHGSCRVFRRFNFENDHYTDLSDAALAGWKQLEADSGETILIPSPVLEAGPRSAMVAASRAVATCGFRLVGRGRKPEIPGFRSSWGLGCGRAGRRRHSKGRTKFSTGWADPQGMKRGGDLVPW